MKKIAIVGLCAFLAAGFAAAQSQIQEKEKKEKVDYGPILGVWTLEMTMQDNTFFMTLELKLTEGKIAGTLSDQMGMMPNAPLSNIVFDGAQLKADIKAVTPPDNAERLLQLDARLVENKLNGSLLVTDFGMSLPFTGTKK